MSETDNIEYASPSPERLADLKRLVDDHGMSLDMISSLSSSKMEARAHLKFFKRMMIISNGLLMFLGLTLAGFGILRLMDTFSILALIYTIAGRLLFLKSASVFASMNKPMMTIFSSINHFDDGQNYL